MKLTKKLSEFNDRSNLWLKILAVIISVLLWLVVVNVSDPVISTSFSGVPVEVTGVDQLLQDGKVYDLVGPETVTVTVSAKRSILDILSKDNLRAVADLRNLDENTGLVTLKVESSKYNEKIESMKAKEETAQIEIDNLQKRQLAIVPIVLGAPEDTFVVGDVTMDQNIVRISGPEKVISDVAKVQAEVSVDGMSSNVSTTVELRYYNAKGELLPKKDITSNISSVAMVTEILATKTVPLKANIVGEPAAGYGLTGEVKIKPAEVMIAGKSSVLKNISEIVIPSDNLSVADAKSTIKYTLDLADYLPEGTRFADEEQDETLKVSIGIEAKQEKEFSISKSMIEISNVPEGFTAEVGIDKAIAVTFAGLPDVMGAFGLDQVKASIDMKEYMREKGITEFANATYGVPITFSLPEGVAVKGNRTISVNVRIRKSE